MVITRHDRGSRGSGGGARVAREIRATGRQQDATAVATRPRGALHERRSHQTADQSPRSIPQPASRAAAALKHPSRGLADQFKNTARTEKGLGENIPRQEKQCWELTPLPEDHATPYPPSKQPEVRTVPFRFRLTGETTFPNGEGLKPAPRRGGSHQTHDPW